MSDNSAPAERYDVHEDGVTVTAILKSWFPTEPVVGQKAFISDNPPGFILVGANKKGCEVTLRYMNQAPWTPALNPPAEGATITLS